MKGLDRRTISAVLVAISAFLFAGAAQAQVRIKDIIVIKGKQERALLGYGLVVGLLGTGDTPRNAVFTRQSVQSMLDHLGIAVKEQDLKTRNVAAVLVTALLPEFVSQGSRIDVTVSSLGDAKSLKGGNLILTPLRGSNGKTFGVAQGQVTVSGINVRGQSQIVTQGVPTVGRIANGGLIQRRITSRFQKMPRMSIELRNPDFNTATSVADAINTYSLRRFGRRIAQPVNAASLAIVRPRRISNVRLISEIGELEVVPDVPARIVIDSRSGTVVIGSAAKISTVAVTHGNLTVRITETPKVSQPLPFSKGRTRVVPQTTVQARETGGHFTTIGGGDLQTLVQGLNLVGVRPAGIIAILQAIKSAGALQAELVVQ